MGDDEDRLVKLLFKERDEFLARATKAEARIAELTAALERVTKELEWKQAEADDAHKDVNEWASRYDQLRADLERERASHERDLRLASEITRGAMDDRAAACASLGQALTLLRLLCEDRGLSALHEAKRFLAAHPSPPREPT